ncbi:hypothetical protein SBA1_1900002 [Candidatus Sulfotelmatobacter kueseliae]|uniref:Uncharacterized protein n=1 Tax=Candidatus Sulfotelmatobacter kueseliae TaxID=2042962 RepID=A0A2U3KF33_9BACT|nr:hypothetical protein SBA1_1900002 [Candidatus Sulfotelmatobacter kueseliae]
MVCGDAPNSATTPPDVSKTAPVVRHADLRNWRLDSDNSFIAPPCHLVRLDTLIVVSDGAHGTLFLPSHGLFADQEVSMHREVHIVEI